MCVHVSVDVVRYDLMYPGYDVINGLTHGKFLILAVLVGDLAILVGRGDDDICVCVCVCVCVCALVSQSGNYKYTIANI